MVSQTALHDLYLLKNAIIQNRCDICEDMAGKYRRSIPHVPFVHTINVHHRQDHFADLLLPEDIPVKAVTSTSKIRWKLLVQLWLCVDDRK